jgi:hypothetical protein
MEQQTAGENSMPETTDWNRLSSALAGLHRALIERTRHDYERDHGKVGGPAHFLRLLMEDPFFAWLRPLSELMANIDQIREFEPPARDEVSAAVRSTVEQLIAAPSGEPASPEFTRHYWPLMLEVPEVTMAHAGVKQALSVWPSPQEGGAARLLHERHLLAEMVKHPSSRTRH